MKNLLKWLLWAVITAVFTTACSTSSTEPAVNQPQGPALVMFYTEG